MMRGASLVVCLAALAAMPARAVPPEVIIDPGGAPPAVLQIIADAVEAITRLAQDQDVREVSRLRRRARDAALAALHTQGYFAGTATLEVSPDPTTGGEFWDISIDPGKRAGVRHVGLRFQGALAADAARQQKLRQAWPLAPGEPFVNDAWSQAKTSWLDEIGRRDYHFARYLSTRATVDAQAGQVDLDLTVDSGPRVRLGRLRVDGLKRVPQSLVRRYVHYERGDPYDRTRMEDWQQALQSTVFFRGAFVTLDTAGYEPPVDGADPVATDDVVTLPVLVRVTEAPARYFSGSLGVDSDHGARVEALYRQNVVFGWPVSIQTGAGVDADSQRVFFDVHRPPNWDGSIDSFGALYDHSDVSGVENHRLGLGWTRSQMRKGAGDSRVEYEVRWATVLAHDKTRISGAQAYEVPSLAASWQWLRRDVDSKYLPREGNLVEFGLGAGTTLDDGKLLLRGSLRMQQWWPVGQRDVLTLRGEFGRAWADTERLPQDFSWRTGGARTIRGYRYRSIGLRRGKAVIGAPMLGVVSLQYTHYFTDMLGANLFVDAGDAAASWRSFRWHAAYGAGLAVRTPAGPFNVDLAWAQRDRRLRLQFSLGIAF